MRSMSIEHYVHLLSRKNGCWLFGTRRLHTCHIHFIVTATSRIFMKFPNWRKVYPTHIHHNITAFTMNWIIFEYGKRTNSKTLPNQRHCKLSNMHPKTDLNEKKRSKNQNNKQQQISPNIICFVFKVSIEAEQLYRNANPEQFQCKCGNG